MTRKTPVNVAASVRARLLAVSKERQEDFTLTLMNYAAERFLYRLAQSKYRDRFVLKGAMLFAVRVGRQYRPTRDLDLLGLGEASETAVATAVRDIATTKVGDDGLIFDVGGLEVHAIREDNAYGGIRAVMQAHLAEARIHVQIDVGFARLPLLRRTLSSQPFSPTWRRQMCWHTRPKPSSPRRRKRWCISVFRTAAWQRELRRCCAGRTSATVQVLPQKLRGLSLSWGRCCTLEPGSHSVVEFSASGRHEPSVDHESL